MACYLPNGNPVIPENGGDTFHENIPISLIGWRWAHAKTLLSYGKPRAGGRYNVIPTPADCRPRQWEGDALYRPERTPLASAQSGLTEAVATLAVTDDTTYTFWDYQGGARRKNNGIRIDHLLSPLAADRLTNFGIDAYTFGKNLRPRTRLGGPVS